MIFKSCECCILGAGPAGLGAAAELAKHGVKDTIIVDRNHIVGGLARTEVHEGARFDIGPHRFFTRNPEIEALWKETLGPDFIPVSRLTRILYNKKFFHYPIKPVDVLLKLGPVESLKVIASFVASKLAPPKKPDTFEDWVVQKFGRALYSAFFKTYTEKVWGRPCDQISAQWAEQRIKDLSVLQILKKAILKKKDNHVRSLVEEFHYPVLGSGQMYEALRRRIESGGAEVLLKAAVTGIRREGATIKSVDVCLDGSERMNITARHFFSSIPLKGFFSMLDPQEPTRVQEAVKALRYRDHITVNLLLEGEGLFPDQWIYIHSPDVRMARLVNYGNFSKAMVDHPGTSALGVEYFVFQNEGLWNETDEALERLAVDELKLLGFVQGRSVKRSWVVREAQAYPASYVGFEGHYDVLKSRIDEFSNFSAIGRGGMHKYNNQDHSIMTGILAARNYLRLPGAPYDLWKVNADDVYHEMREGES
ncbi:MAG TPA: FAD-dependent oxidoreductase [Candidatus Omnitrophota bacterium]|nr:FAD-dependent oxidoreductase [Candidatus Omnitrophota bacterium]HSA30510.1 FAD-dependent oxidoreductase [Candidatus Omnitrophota bacterium]